MFNVRFTNILEKINCFELLYEKIHIFLKQIASSLQNRKLQMQYYTINANKYINKSLGDSDLGNWIGLDINKYILQSVDRFNKYSFFLVRIHRVM